MPSPATEPGYFSPQMVEAQRFYLSLHPDADRKRGKVVSGGLEHCSPDYDLARNDFPLVIIELVIKGAGEATLFNTRHPLLPGTVMIYGPKVPHRIRADRQRGLSKYFVAVSGSEILAWLREARLPERGVLHVGQPEELAAIYSSLIASARSDQHARQRQCLATFQYLLVRLGQLATAAHPSTGAALATYQRCRRYIEEHYRSVASLEEVARACHVAPSHLSRLFSQFQSQPPFQFLQHLKMNRAVELLDLHGWSVKEVALDLGFSDPGNFTRAFKRVYGISPQVWLRRSFTKPDTESSIQSEHR